MASLIMVLANLGALLVYGWTIELEEPAEWSAYRGAIQNRAIIGLSDAALKLLPGAEQPKDPLGLLPLRRAG